MAIPFSYDRHPLGITQDTREGGGVPQADSMQEWKWRATSKPGHVYLILFAWPNGGSFLVPGLPHKISSARLLADPSVKLSVVQNADWITISGLPERSPDPVASVIDLSY